MLVKIEEVPQNVIEHFQDLKLEFQELKDDQEMQQKETGDRLG